MDKTKRKAVIAGNWKMNLTPSGAKALLEELKPMVAGMDGCEIVVCVPFVDLYAAKEVLAGSNIRLGAQNVHFADKGAYTGEISASMLVECGAEYVIIGHSERRQYFGETDKTVNQRLTAALQAGLTPIVCVGELLDERDAGITDEVVSRQLKLGLAGVSAEDMKRVIIAYEPVWAIGTGRVATPRQAQEVCHHIRRVIAKLYTKEIAEAVTVQYGGSMKPSNADELLARPDVDGGLIGGASLKAADFTALVKAAQ